MTTFRNLLGCSLLVLAACSSTPSTTADSSTPPADASGDAAADTGGNTCITRPMRGACATQMGTEPVCPSGAIAQANMMQPSFRFTHINITAPAALRSPLLANIVNNALRTGTFLWGATFDRAANTIRTGPLRAMYTPGTVGQGLYDGTFSFYNNNAPGTGMAGRWNPLQTATMAMGDRVSTTVLMGTVRLPIFADDGCLLTELPLENAQMSNVLLAGDLKCIGRGNISMATAGIFNECNGSWVTQDAMMMPYGRLTAAITVAAARTVQVSSLNTTLCNLLAGANCETDMNPMAWRMENRPDTMVNGQPAWTLTTEFAAVSARIQ